MLPKELCQENYDAINVALRLVKKTQGRKSSKCLFVDHQTTAKREQNMTVLLENNVSVSAKSVCDLCPLLRTRTFGTFSLVLLDFFSNHQIKIKKSLRVALRRRLAEGHLRSWSLLRVLPLTPPIDTSVWSGAAHEKTGLQWNGTRLSLVTNPDSISTVMTIVFMCGEPVVNASILPLLYSDNTAPTAGVMVWAAIAYNIRSPLVLILSTTAAQRYAHDILQPHVLSLMQRLPGAIFQQNNAQSPTPIQNQRRCSYHRMNHINDTEPLNICKQNNPKMLRGPQGILIQGLLRTSYASEKRMRKFCVFVSNATCLTQSDRGKGLEVRLSLALSTIQVTVRFKLGEIPRRDDRWRETPPISTSTISAWN
ncbi:uncharacterized protein TNCV_2468851 [Trichonephila clavipes]|nr:uncharacterized protein TNCV_2468851 [Trichonephila clavipes]